MQTMQANPTEPALRDTQALTIADLERLAMAIRLKDQPHEIFRAVHEVAASTIGFRLLTIMSYDAQHHEVERVYTNMPDVYPLGGRKKKQGTAWAKQILQDLRPFRAATSQGIREAFDDHAVMAGMGLGSILNIPIAYDGVCIGTMNLTHEEGWYASHHESMGLTIGAFLAPALLKQNAQFSAGTVHS
ncbi:MULTISPECIES: GAF domain-containing protein [Burkholderiaceae]|uniref:GAF domain-containing protein n=1 Tax=Burkholderiaceae TaxID=119060 RepID=UPI00141FE25E|nr:MULTISPECIES: GAF domain-containing protein [Burkholderiaceae]MBN3849526.1 GAF domain-containing protein [Paraburkholderia sp. Ac-20342]NIF51145.1 GAF domain-containing protein [Burkholderia sp. Ax-1724]